MTDTLRTLSARLITGWRIGPRALQVRAWEWLCANTEDLREKQRCLEAILDLEPDSAWVSELLQRVLQLQRTVTDLHPANAEELANIAQETGAEVLRGALRYPSESGGWQLGDLDLSEHLDKYRDRDLMVIVASVGKAEEEQVVCGVCGFALNQVGECPRCKLQNEEAAKGLRARRQREQLFREIDELVRDRWEDAEGP